MRPLRQKSDLLLGVSALVIALAGCHRSPAELPAEGAEQGGGAIAAAAPAVSPVPQATTVPSVRDDLPAPEDDYYGVYLQGHKVGWMRSQLLVGKTVQLLTTLNAKVGGLGQVSKLSLHESRTYDATSGNLLSLSFAQTASTGTMKVEGRVKGHSLHLAITSGGETTNKTVPVKESLTDALLPWRLAQSQRIGAKGVAVRFDASVLKTEEVHYSLTKSKTRMLAGVETRVFELVAKYPSMGVQESSWVDSNGTVLETHVGGFFVARLEPEDQAKKLTYSQDILVSAVVKSPVDLGNPEAVDHVQLTFEGFGSIMPPSSPRQKVTRVGSTVVLEEQRDPQPPDVKLPATVRATEADLKPTPFIQCDSPKIIAAAHEAAAGATTVFEATTKLVHWVYGYVHDEYVPAYSNALEVLKTKRGDCTEHAVLFVALARALGIPARVAVGIAYWPAGGGFGWHAWAEARAGDTWYTVDPTWDEPIADATHVKLAGGGAAQQARIVMLLGKLSITNVKQ